MQRVLVDASTVANFTSNALDILDLLSWNTKLVTLCSVACLSKTSIDAGPGKCNAFVVDELSRKCYLGHIDPLVPLPSEGTGQHKIYRKLL